MCLIQFFPRKNKLRRRCSDILSNAQCAKHCPQHVRCRTAQRCSKVPEHIQNSTRQKRGSGRQVMKVGGIVKCSRAVTQATGLRAKSSLRVREPRCARARVQARCHKRYSQKRCRWCEQEGSENGGMGMRWLWRRARQWRRFLVDLFLFFFFICGGGLREVLSGVGRPVGRRD